MKILKITCTALMLLATTFALKAQVNPSQTYVSGYYKSDGSYIQGHYKTTQNFTNRDNFTTRPNVNPYTAQPGYITPDNKGLSSSNWLSSPSSTYPAQRTYTPSSTYTMPSSNTIHTGSRGGQYYINSNGNKTYIKR